MSALLGHRCRYCQGGVACFEARGSLPSELCKIESIRGCFWAAIVLCWDDVNRDDRYDLHCMSRSVGISVPPRNSREYPMSLTINCTITTVASQDLSQKHPVLPNSEVFKLACLLFEIVSPTSSCLGPWGELEGLPLEYANR